MLTLIYCLAGLAIFNHLIESESEALQMSLGQRQLTILLGAAIVWPIVALGLLYECRRELFDNIRVLLDLDLDIDQLMTQINPHPEMEDYLDEVDPETL